MKNRKTECPDEAACYLALARAVENSDRGVGETEEQPMPKKPPTTVSAYKLRKILRHIDQ
jgi:hypothetical protein